MMSPEVIHMRNEEREEMETVASATECTGLVPAISGDGGEETLRALCAVQPAKRSKPRKIE